MQWLLQTDFEPMPTRIGLSDRMFVMGSCFATHVHEYLNQRHFHVSGNPNGIMFNPLSIAAVLKVLVHNEHAHAQDVFQHNDLWFSWTHHGQFYATSKDDLVQRLQENHLGFQKKLEQTNYLILSWGTAFVYELIETGEVVANCHKVPANRFNKRLCSVEEITSSYIEILDVLKQRIPYLKVILTISPVKYLRDGVHANNLSKSVLMLALDELQKKYTDIYYFPSFEMVQDELRDYRFYEADFAHPNEAAIGYVMQKFMSLCLDQPSQEMIVLADKLYTAAHHKTLHPESAENQRFLEQLAIKQMAFKKQYPMLNW